MNVLCVSVKTFYLLYCLLGDFTNILISRPLRSQNTQHHKTSAYFSTRSCLWYVRIIVCVAVISACRVTRGSDDTLAQSLWHPECHHWVYSKIKSCEVEPHHHLFQTDLCLSSNLQKNTKSIMENSWKLTHQLSQAASKRLIPFCPSVCLYHMNLLCICIIQILLLSLHFLKGTTPQCNVL